MPPSRTGLYAIWLIWSTVVLAAVYSILPSALTVMNMDLPFTTMDTFLQSNYSLIGGSLGFARLNVRNNPRNLPIFDVSFTVSPDRPCLRPLFFMRRINIVRNFCHQFRHSNSLWKFESWQSTSYILNNRIPFFWRGILRSNKRRTQVWEKKLVWLVARAKKKDFGAKNWGWFLKKFVSWPHNCIRMRHLIFPGFLKYPFCVAGKIGKKTQFAL